jgi:excisionase family DNA binding protein
MNMSVIRTHDYMAQGAPNKLVDINELSRLISVPRGTLYNLVYLRKIPFVKRGRSLRFDPEDVIRSLPHFDTIGSAGQRGKAH